MASGITNFCANLLFEKLLRGTAGSWPATFYVALSSTLPTDTGTNFTEPTGVGAYARQPLVTATTTWAALAAGSTSNAAVINYPNATATIGTMTDWGLFDLLTGGNLHLWADLTTPQTIASGNPYSFAIGALVIGAI